MPAPLLAARWISRGLVALLLGAGIALTILVSINREFQVDEVEHIHTAYNMRDGRVIYRDFVQVHPPLLYALLYPLVDPVDPVGSFRLGRVYSTALLLATLALVAWSAGRLAGPGAGVFAGGLALLETTLVERGIEVRADGALAFLIMLALASEVGDWWRDEARRFAMQGLLLGAGLMLTLKAIFAVALFGVLWLATAVRRRRLALVLAPAAGVAVPLLVALAVTALAGAAHEFVEQSLLDAGSAGLGSELRSTFSPAGPLLREGSRNLAFFACVLLGTLFEVRRIRARLPEAPGRRFLLGLSWGLFASLWANPFPWPYVQVSMLPPFAVLAAVGLVSRAESAAATWRATWSRWLVPAVLLLAGVSALPRLASRSLPAMAAQLDTLVEVQRVTDPDDRLFDLVGLYFRPDAYPVFSMSGDLFRWYSFGRFPPIPETLRANQAVGVILNYRVGWLRPHERQFVGERFVHYSGNLFLLGRDLARLPPGIEVEHEVLKERVFRFEGRGALRVDGRAFSEGLLARGSHSLRVDRLEGPGRLILATPPPIPPARPPVDLFVHFD
jgi:hypothetical protein